MASWKGIVEVTLTTVARPETTNSTVWRWVMGRPGALEPETQPRWGSWKGKLLVVDEDVEDLLYYSAVLQNHGYEVRSIPSYSDGATCLEGEDFDLIIVSQGSRNFEGRHVLARAIEKDRRTPVLVFTKSVDMPCYMEAIQLGALDYLEKPSPPSEIGKLVAKYLPSLPADPQASQRDD